MFINPGNPTEIGVIPSEINMKNGHPSQISLKLGTYIVGVETLNHNNFWCPVLYGFLVITRKAFAINGILSIPYTIKSNLSRNIHKLLTFKRYILVVLEMSFRMIP